MLLFLAHADARFFSSRTPLPCAANRTVLFSNSEEGQKKVAMNFCVSHFRTEMEVRTTGLSLGVRAPDARAATARGRAVWENGRRRPDDRRLSRCCQAKYCMDKILQDVSYDDATYYKAEPLNM